MSPAVSRRRFLQLAAGVGAVSLTPALRAQAMAAARDGVDLGADLRRGEWLAGDFHCHTVFSHDVWGGPGDDNTSTSDFYTLGWQPGEQITIAETRGLDFLAITDHNRLDALHQPDYASDKVVLVPGYEHSLSGGHAGVFVPSLADLPAVLTDTVGGGTGFVGDAGIRRFVDQVHARSGMTVLNHPFGGAVWKYAIAPSVGFDAIEVWNSHWLARDDTVQLAASNNNRSIAWWESEFIGHHVNRAAVGGSDNHWRSTLAVQGVGQPTTWVYTAARTPAAIIAAVQAGRTCVAQNPPLMGGARIELSAVEDWGANRAAMVGGALRWGGPLTVTVKVENGQGNVLRLVSGGRVVAESAVVSPVSTHRTASIGLAPGGWLRAELYQSPGYLMTAITSPIYAAADQAPPRIRVDPATGPAVGYGAIDLTTIPEVDTCC